MSHKQDTNYSWDTNSWIKNSHNQPKWQLWNKPLLASENVSVHRHSAPGSVCSLTGGLSPREGCRPGQASSCGFTCITCLIAPVTRIAALSWIRKFPMSTRSVL